MENSRIIQGLMRLNYISVEELEELVKFDLDHGINYFDTSSVYGDGISETKLGEVIKRNPGIREKMIIQTKCGIIKRRKENVNYYDLSKENIISSLKESLKRLNTRYVDYFLLHRLDIFVDNKEVKEAFDYLYKNGLVKHFGVSNFTKEAIEYLEEDSPYKIEVNQLQLGIGHLPIISNELNFNTFFDEGVSRSSDIFFYLKRKGIKLQCWSPFQYGMFEGIIFDENKFKDLNIKLEELAKKYKSSKSSIAVAFLLNLSGNVEVLLGSTKKEHIEDALSSINLNLSKEDWYALYKSAQYKLP